jgi:septum formation inhibitor-activating ATPase MinD
LKKTPTKKEKFQIVATRRIQNALDHLTALNKCANRDKFDYNEEDVNKMMKELKNKVNFLEMQFSDGLENGSKKFKF